MSYEIKPLRGKVGLSTDLAPLYFETGLQAPEMATLNFVFTIDAVSAGITLLNPATLLCEHSWDGGKTWTTIPSMVTEDVNAAGVFRAYVSNATGLVAPNVRISIVCPAGEEVVIGKAERSHISPRDSVFLQPPAIPGGIASEATLADILVDTTAIKADTATLAAKDFATSAKQDTIISYVDGIEGKLDTLNAKDFATSAKQDTIISELAEQASGKDPQTFVEAHSSKNIPTTWGTTFFTTVSNVRSIAVFDDCGSAYELGWGGAAKMIVPPGGIDGAAPLLIPSGTAVQLRSLTGAAISSGTIFVSMVG